MRKILAPLALTLLTTSSFAAEFFVVVPVKGRTAAAPAEAISVTLNPYTMPEALEGKSYSFNLKPLLSVTGDSAYNGAGVTWSVVSSSLPAGLYLTVDGFIGGTPTAAGTGAITVRATYKAKNGEQTYQVVSAALTVSLATATLPEAVAGTFYSYNFKELASSNDPSFNSTTSPTYSIKSTPTGLSFSNGILSGTPTVKNTDGVPIEVTANYKGKQGSQVYTLIVNGESLLAKQISAGYQFTCALTSADAVKCWGRDDAGQLGDGGSNLEKYIPTQVVGLTSGVLSISSGYNYACAVISGGTVRCWGDNNYAQLGSGTVDAQTPREVTGLSGVKNVYAGKMNTCALMTTGSVKCWGYNNIGQLGNGITTASASPPVDVVNLTNVTEVSVGGNHSCALTSTGEVKCWGGNYYGQLGDGTTTNSNVPLTVSLGSSAKGISVGLNYSCAVLTSGAVKCWGLNSAGQLGDGTKTNSFTPVQVPSLSAIKVSANNNFTCALTTEGIPKCWGVNNYGQLGNGTNTASTLVETVNGLSGVVDVSAGNTHACALKAYGGAFCWGYNFYGGLGDGTTVQRNSPVAVSP